MPPVGTTTTDETSRWFCHDACARSWSFFFGIVEAATQVGHRGRNHIYANGACDGAVLGLAQEMEKYTTQDPTLTLSPSPFLLSHVFIPFFFPFPLLILPSHSFPLQPTFPPSPPYILSFPSSLFPTDRSRVAAIMARFLPFRCLYACRWKIVMHE